MGIYSEYLAKFSSGNFDELSAERKIQLKRIADLRGRDVLVFAADINKGNQQISSVLNWRKTMQSRGNYGSDGERRASSHAGGLPCSLHGEHFECDAAQSACPASDKV